jgi:hypothetical protein
VLTSPGTVAFWASKIPKLKIRIKVVSAGKRDNLFFIAPADDVTPEAVSEIAKYCLIKKLPSKHILIIPGHAA